MKKITHAQYIIIALTALLCLVTLLLAVNYDRLSFAPWARPAQTPVNVTAVPPGTVNKPVRILRTGSIENSASVPVRAQFSGRLSEVYVTEGQTVKAGQPLCKLEGTPEPAASQPANQTAAASPQAQANYDNALKEYNRYEKLYEMGAIARRQLEMSAARLQAAKESLSAARSSAQPPSVPRSGSVTATAPIDGIVTGLSAAAGKMVQAGQQLLSLGSGQEVEVVAHLQQNDLYLVHLGTPAAIGEAQQSIPGQVSRIYPQVEANQVPAFLAHIKLADNPNGLLKPGMSVDVGIDTGKSAPVPAVPTAAICRDYWGRNYIFLADGGKAVLQQISTGETIGDFTEVTSDLPPQSMVITSSLNTIKDGDPVVVQ